METPVVIKQLYNILKLMIIPHTFESRENYKLTHNTMKGDIAILYNATQH